MEKLRIALENLHFPAEKALLEKFEAYREQVLCWNEKINLTAITDREEFVIKHFVDSILCADRPEVKRAETVIDVGTGAGFPGVPLALLFPEKHFLLVDSLQKRVRIVKEICDAVGIPNVTLLHGRAEDLAQDPAYREKFDLCVSRAVAKLSILAEYCLPFVRTGGYFLAYKGPGAGEELDAARGPICTLGGRFAQEVGTQTEYFFPDHKLLFVEKVRTTPAKYPRKAGAVAKEPLK